eukprot:gene13810-15255_t
MKWKTVGSVAVTAANKGCAAGNQVVQHEKSETWQGKDKKAEISEEEIKQVVAKLSEFSSIKAEFLEKIQGWKKIREETISQLKTIATECNDLHRDCNIANVTGSSVGAAGGLMALGGILLAPFTFGSSLTLTVAGAATGVAGAATNITTSIVESSKMSTKCETAQNCLARDKTETDALNITMEKLMGFVDTLDTLQEQLAKIEKLEKISIGLDAAALATSSVSSAASIAKGAQALKLIRSFTAAEIAVLKECPKMLKNLKAFKGTALAAGKVATFFAVASLGISIYEIVTTSKDIHNGSETEAAQKLRENAKSLQEQLDTLCQIEKSLRGE